MRRFFLLGTLLWLLPLLCYGDTATTYEFSNSGTSHFFDPAPNDQSLVYLGELFGSIPPVLGGTGTTLLAQLFRLFNTITLSVGIFFLAYTVFVGILNTAGQGELLGKKWSSLSVSIRLVLGLALLVPTPSGFCVCQIFLMWMIIQGVGAADHLTNQIVDYMEENRAIFVKSNSAASQDGNNTDANTDYDNTIIQSLYQGLSCVQATQKKFPNNNPNPMPLPKANIKTDSSGNITSISYIFQGKNDSNGTIACGTLKASYKEQKYYTYAEQAINAIMPSLNSAAYFMVNYNPTTEAIFMPENDTYENQVLQASYDFVGSSFLTQVEQTYASYLQQVTTPESSDNGYLENIRAYGWVSLGDLYWKMAQSSDSQKANYTYGTISWTNGIDGAAGAAPAPGNEATINLYTTNWATDFIASLINTRDSQNTGGSAFKQPTEGGSETLTTALIYKVGKAIMNNLSDGANPLIQSQKVGHDTIVAIEITFAILIPLIIITTTFGSFSGCSSAFLVIQLLWATLLPGVFALLTFLSILGGILAVVIPMIPATIFFIAVINWLISTVETEMAGPIVAVAVLHPETHEIFGKAEPAIMLTLSIFLRPSLMVIGLAAGSLICFVSMQFINFAFFNIIGLITDNTKLSAIEMILYLTTYVGLVVAAVNKSFGVITSLPDQVMRWISGGEGSDFSRHGSQEDAHYVQEQQAKGSQAHGELGAEQKQDMEGGAEAKGTKLGQQREIKNKQLEEETKQEAAQAKEAEDSSPTTDNNPTTPQPKKAQKNRSAFQKKLGFYQNTNQHDNDYYE